MTLESTVEEVAEKLEQVYLENYDIKSEPKIRALKKAIKLLNERVIKA